MKRHMAQCVARHIQHLPGAGATAALIAACHQLIQPIDFARLGAGADDGGTKFGL